MSNLSIPILKQLPRPYVSMLKQMVFFFPLVLAVGFAVIYVFSPNMYLVLIEEDGISEDAQAVVYFLTSAIGFATAMILRKYQRKHLFWLFIMFAFSTLFIGFEEISWGQRIFGIQTPDFFKVESTQSDLTIHNLKPVEKILHPGFTILGFYGGLAWIFTSKTKNWKATDLRRFIIPGWYLSFYFLPVAAWYVYYHYIREREYFIHPQIGMWRHQEFFELLVALGFLFVAIINYKKVTELSKH